MGLINLSYLDLSNNKLANSSISGLVNLKYLIVSNLNFTSSGLNFELFSELEELDFSENNFIETNRLKNMSKLKRLNLKKTNFDNCFFLII
jgi:Leucine-rich repeat (LRR) protein